MERFDVKAVSFATALCDVYKDEKDRGGYKKLELKEENLTEDFTAILWGFMTLYRHITDDDVDILGFISLLNRLAFQYLTELGDQK